MDGNRQTASGNTDYALSAQNFWYRVMQGISRSSGTGVHDTALQAFQAGIANLLVQAGHWNADYSEIIKSNLHLLHRALLNDPEYRYQIKRHLHRSGRPPMRNITIYNLLQHYRHMPFDRRSTMPEGGHPKRSLEKYGMGNHLTTNSLQASLITIAKGQSIQLCAPHMGLSLYMPVLGKLTDVPAEAPTGASCSGWWHRLIANNHYQASTLKSGDVLLLNKAQNSNRIMKADRQACVLLCVSLLFPLE